MTTQRQTAPVKQIERARLDARALSLSALESLLAPCLKWRHQFRLHPPKASEISTAFRSEELKDAAHRVFPLSSHTEFNESLVNEFEDFVQLREQLTASASLSKQDVSDEVCRPQSLLVTDWSASLFDGALSPETDGFIDEDGMPPWDTWLGLVHIEGAHGLACLLSWLPRWMADKVDFAVKIDAAESLSWVKVENNSLALHGWGKAASE